MKEFINTPPGAMLMFVISALIALVAIVGLIHNFFSIRAHKLQNGANKR